MTTAQMTTDQLTEILDGLFSNESTAKENETPSKIDDPRVVATYKDCEGVFHFAIVCELSIANSLGAALTMIPATAAQEATAAGTSPDNIRENIYEVLNICSAALADFHGHRIVLDGLFTPGEAIDSEIATAIDSATSLLQVNYELERYDPGNISLLKIS